jgi:hypothetical protein
MRNDSIRQDAYSIILFNSTAYAILRNNFDYSPEDLLNVILAYGPGSGTNYTAALAETRRVIDLFWDAAR